MEYTINANKADGTYVPLFKFEDENAAIEKVIRAGCDDDEEFERIKKDPVEYDGHDCMVRSRVTDAIIARCDPEDMYGFGITYEDKEEEEE